jgi:hypothetical protein
MGWKRPLWPGVVYSSLSSCRSQSTRGIVTVIDGTHFTPFGVATWPPTMIVRSRARAIGAHCKGAAATCYSCWSMLISFPNGSRT